MSNAFHLASATPRRHDPPRRALRIVARKGSALPRAGSTEPPASAEAAAKSLPATNAARGPADTIWRSVLWFFLEGFALYGASVHWVATTAVTAIASEVDARQRRKPVRHERQKSISLVSPAARATGTVFEPEEVVDGMASGTRMPFAEDGSASAVRGVDRHRSVHPGWLVMTWRAIASWWAMRRREREIKEAVAALAEYDDRMLLDMGFPHRSQIEEIVRNGRDC